MEDLLRELQFTAVLREHLLLFLHLRRKSSLERIQHTLQRHRTHETSTEVWAPMIVYNINLWSCGHHSEVLYNSGGLMSVPWPQHRRPHSVPQHCPKVLSWSDSECQSVRACCESKGFNHLDSLNELESFVKISFWYLTLSLSLSFAVPKLFGSMAVDTKCPLPPCPQCLGLPTQACPNAA